VRTDKLIGRLVAVLPFVPLFEFWNIHQERLQQPQQAHSIELRHIMLIKPVLAPAAESFNHDVQIIGAMVR